MKPISATMFEHLLMQALSDALTELRFPGAKMHQVYSNPVAQKLYEDEKKVLKERYKDVMVAMIQRAS